MKSRSSCFFLFFLALVRLHLEAKSEKTVFTAPSPRLVLDLNSTHYDKQKISFVSQRPIHLASTANSWGGVSVVLMQCYVTKLTSILTEDQAQMPLDIDQPCVVGYRKGSFVKEFLVKHLEFSKWSLKPYSSIEEYPMALSKGSRNGGVAAIFDELPYINSFILKYGSAFTVLGPISNISPFVFHEKFGYAFSFRDELLSRNLSPKSSLDACSFGGLFIFTGAAAILALICSEISRWRRFCQGLACDGAESSTVQFMIEMNVTGDSTITSQQQHHPVMSNQSSDLDVSTEEEASEEELSS